MDESLLINTYEHEKILLLIYEISDGNQQKHITIKNMLANIHLYLLQNAKDITINIPIIKIDLLIVLYNKKILQHNFTIKTMGMNLKLVLKIMESYYKKIHLFDFQ